MHNLTMFSVVNIRTYLSNSPNIRETLLLQELLSDFSCKANVDIERFLKKEAIEFTKKNQSVTYLVLSNNDASLLGYFTLTMKPLMINTESFSNTSKRKISRISEQNTDNNYCSLSAYLIAQLGKNFANNANEQISGKQLLSLAMKQIHLLQYQLGGMVVFLEAQPLPALLKFYQEENGFIPFATREAFDTHQSPYILIQMLKLL